MKVDFSRDASGAVKMETDGNSTYLSGFEGLFITGKEDAYRSTQPVVKAPQVVIQWNGGSMKYWLDEIEIGGVQQTDLEDCKAALATTIFNVEPV